MAGGGKGGGGGWGLARRYCLYSALSLSLLFVVPFVCLWCVVAMIIRSLPGKTVYGLVVTPASLLSILFC